MGRDPMDANELQQALTVLPVHAPLQQIHDPRLLPTGINFYLKREDLIHPTVSGNKWRKLKYNLIQAAADKQTTLLTFGGAYSNHILATAHAGQLFGFKTIGIIRGEEYSPLNPVLEEAKNQGMELHYMQRWQYRKKDSAEVRSELESRFGSVYYLPEGGTNALAVRGCQEIIDDINIAFDVVCCACGTGGTLAGLISGLQTHQQALGVAVLKGEPFLKRNVQNLLPPAIATSDWGISFDYHLGGYAKKNLALTQFINRFQTLHHIQLDPIYTGKLIFGLYDLIQKGHFEPDQTIVAIHTGNNPAPS